MTGVQPLVIEYVLDGARRGYNFTSPTVGYSDAALKTIWQRAMPRGQGWNAPIFAGARSLKCFPVGDRLALSEIVVTSLRDENGRGGIRRAVVELLTAPACVEALRGRLRGYPPSVRETVDGRPSVGQWKRIVDHALPKLYSSEQMVFSAPYEGVAGWQAMEALVLKVAISRVGTLAHAGHIIPFTTLALDYRDDLQIVAIPSQSLPESLDVAVLAFSEINGPG